MADTAYGRLAAEVGRIYGELIRAQEEANALRTQVAERDATIADLRGQLAAAHDANQKEG